MRIDYAALATGNIQEIRHVFARIVFDTVFPLHQDQDQALMSSRVSQGGQFEGFLENHERNAS